MMYSSQNYYAHLVYRQVLNCVLDHIRSNNSYLISTAGLHMLQSFNSVCNPRYGTLGPDMGEATCIHTLDLSSPQSMSTTC